jgi:SulP family sulfate permease
MGEILNVPFTTVDARVDSMPARNYTQWQFTADLLAGVTVGLLPLPLAMAFGIAAIAGAIISALGGSRTQIGGPTNAFVVIVAGIVPKPRLPGLALVTLMAGGMLILMGVTGLVAADQPHHFLAEVLRPLPVWTR